MEEKKMADEHMQVNRESTGPQKVEGSAEDEFDISDRKDDDDDEDGESYDDPYTYSDDSASLSDAYFFPQSEDELARPPGYKEEDTLHPYPVGSYYGALDNNSAKNTPPLWLGGSIQEDSEMVSLPQQYDEMNSLMATADNNVNRKRNRRHQRKNLSKQRERISRERTVAQIRGRPQKVKEWQDKFFAYLFLAQLIVILLLALRFGLTMFEINSISSLFRSSKATASGLGSRHLEFQFHSDKSHTFEFTIDYKNVIRLIMISGTYACFLACFSLGFMLIMGKALIQFVLVFSILVALAWGIIGLTEDPYGIIPVMGFSALLMTLGYAFTHWSRIPFVATNLHVAMHAMRCTADITILGFASLMILLTWIVIWSMAFVGIVNSFNSAECTNNLKCEPHVNKGDFPLYLALLFSFHWTNTVIKNIVRVTVASAVGTWWFRPSEVEPFCARAVVKPLKRAITKSLGSICLGSLLVQPCWLLIGLIEWFCCFSGIDDHEPLPLKANDEKTQDVESNYDLQSVQSESAADSIGLSPVLGGCRKRCRKLLRSCNRWSYTYIGLYGYSFEEAGERALQLFATRGWLAVVSDRFMTNILVMASVIIGGSTGTFAVVIEEVDGFFLTSFHKPVITAFVVGSVVGYILGDILLLGLVSSAVDTILVCFAAGPFDFDKNHRILSREMREAWSHHVWEVVH